MPLRRPWLLCLALLAAIAAGPGCFAPTLPLPPPTALIEGPPDADGFVTVSGQAREGAFVACLNEQTEDGVIVRADLATGAYTLRVAAMPEDVLVLWQFDAADEGSMQVRRTVPRE